MHALAWECSSANGVLCLAFTKPWDGSPGRGGWRSTGSEVHTGLGRGLGKGSTCTVSVRTEVGSLAPMQSREWRFLNPHPVLKQRNLDHESSLANLPHTLLRPRVPAMRGTVLQKDYFSPEKQHLRLIFACTWIHIYVHIHTHIQLQTHRYTRVRRNLSTKGYLAALFLFLPWFEKKKYFALELWDGQLPTPERGPEPALRRLL